MKWFSYNIVFFIALFFATTSDASTVYTYSGNEKKSVIIGNYTEILEDTSGLLTFQQIQHSDKFKASTQLVPSFGITPSAYWVKMEIHNESADSALFLELGYSPLDKVTFFTPNNNSYTENVTGEEQAITKRKHAHQNFIFDITIPVHQSRTYYIRVQSSEQILIPLSLGTYDATINSITLKDVLSGIYFGLILVMLLYNIFIYYTVRDRSYLYYVIYIACVGLTQASLQGYTYRFLWPGNPWLANQSVIFFPAVTGLSAFAFLINFLPVRELHKGFIRTLQLLNVFYVINIILSLTGQHRLSQQLIQPNALLGSIVFMVIAIKLLRRGNRPAKFFLLAWSTFLAGIIIFIMKDIGVVPYNNFTNYILNIGSAVEVVVLSLALADKINIFRKEKEESQAQALLALEENARIISEQNVVLETKVTERTIELRETNNELSKTLVDLKEAQAQLVDSEKMASLGQLTAGIAHEINNPINFVTSNVNPLKRDVSILIDAFQQIENTATSDISVQEKQQQIDALKTDIDFDYLKTEIDYLLKGIHEGSSRTAEIVKGLRIFSRLDEDDLKKADINEGIESTMIIVNNLLGDKIEVVKNYGELPLVECYPGKLNQVFMNIITNAIHAITEKYGNEKGGILKITTEHDAQHVHIKIEDNATGMSDITKKKLFEPFFTTKDVGRGTGLGLSIAYNTIKKHNGQIIVNSTLGIGSEFIIELPL